MPFHHVDHFKYFTFDLFDDARIHQAVFTRHGGVSPNPWRSLNLGGTVGDDPERVSENRHRCFDVFDRSAETSFDVWQVHGTEVVCTNSPRPSKSPHQRADVILTDKEEVTLFMRFADCVPIMLTDPIRRVVGLIHAGWMGTVRHICSVTIDAMKNRYGCSPENILAAIGPSICVDHYPVGDDVIGKVEEGFGEDSKDLLVRYPDEKIHLNLWEANRLVLERAGVKNIEISKLCTAHHPQDWYSHRFENGKTGRFGAFISIAGKSNG